MRTNTSIIPNKNLIVRFYNKEILCFRDGSFFVVFREWKGWYFDYG